MASKKSRKIFKIFLNVSMITIFFGGAIATLVAYFSYANKNNESTYVEKDHDWIDLELTQYESKDLPFKLNVYNPKNEEAYLGNEEIKLLTEKIKNELPKGPEYFSLKDIEIGNSNFISNDNNGVFVSDVGKIIINTESLSKDVPYYAPPQAKAQSVFEVLFHEYGHYMAYTYLQSIQDSQITPAEEIYTKTSAKSDGNNANSVLRRGIATKWNKRFYDVFTNALGYDQIGDKPSVTSVQQDSFEKEVTDEHGFQTSQRVKADILPAFYNEAEIFNAVNKGGDLNFNRITTEDVAISSDYLSGQFKPWFKVPRIPIFSKKTSIPYYWSLSELFTRKMQQMTMAAPQITGGSASNWIIDDNSLGTGTYFFKIPGENAAKISFSILLEDALHYQSALVDSGNSTGVFRFFKSAPYAQELNKVTGMKQFVGKRIYDEMLYEMGYKDGDDISFINTKNQAQLKNQNRYVDVEQPSKEIKFGGFIPNKNNYNYVGYMDGNTFKPYRITQTNFNYKMKSSGVWSRIFTPLDSKKENKVYSLENWVNADDFLNKPLYFSSTENGAGKVPLSTIKTGDAGEASTYRISAPDSIKSKVWLAKKDQKTGSVMIGERRW